MEFLFTNDEVKKARSAELVEFCRSKNMKLTDEGDDNYRVSGYGGLIIKNNGFIWYANNDKGNAIDFCLRVLNMSYREALKELLNMPQAKDAPRLRRVEAGLKKKVELPKKANTGAIFSYLSKQRGIKMKIVRKMISLGLLYQDERKNCVFPCLDVYNGVRGAIIRGTFSDNSYKGKAVNSDAAYGWVIAPNGYSETVIVVEAPIDAMSFLDMYDTADRHYVLALGGLNENTLDRFLSEHTNINKIVLALDNDQAGREATQRIRDRYKTELTVNVFLPKVAKDWNEELLSKKKVSKSRVVTFLPVQQSAVGRPY